MFALSHSNRYIQYVFEHIGFSSFHTKGNSKKNTVASEEEPEFLRFLDFLKKDIHDSYHLVTISSDLVYRTKLLTEGVEFDINATLSEEDE